MYLAAYKQLNHPRSACKLCPTIHTNLASLCVPEQSSSLQDMAGFRSAVSPFDVTCYHTKLYSSAATYCVPERDRGQGSPATRAYARSTQLGNPQHISSCVYVVRLAKKGCSCDSSSRCSSAGWPLCLFAAENLFAADPLLRHAARRERTNNIYWRRPRDKRATGHCNPPSLQYPNIPRDS